MEFIQGYLPDSLTNPAKTAVGSKEYVEQEIFVKMYILDCNLP